MYSYCMLVCAHAHRFILEHVLKKSSPVRPVCVPVILALSCMPLVRVQLIFHVN